ncbi:MAG TPA: NADH:ubiquinone reductase (Na(+)-transporting) subunit B [Kiritimatiellia bacterium]|nr:NADH:ubiquinone reductase (Na(+)-transporting) subunit B [Kiritimatiellia bacterium]
MKKFLEQQMDKMRPLFLPGGKFERLYPLHEANETFLLTPAEVTHGAPHVRDQLDLKRTMIMVVLALIPATLFGIFNAGYQHNLAHNVANAAFLDHVLQGLLLCLPIIITSYAVGGLWEVLFAIVRKHPINEGFLVSGLLFPLTLPPTIPLWQVAVGISFGIVIGKEIFGGTGFNVLNPALTARAFLYFAYPAQISGDKVWASGPDGWTGATPLGIGMVPHAGETIIESLNNAGYTLKSMIIGLEPGSIGETSVIACAIGALILILAGVGSWRIMLGTVIGLIAGSFLMQAVGGANLKPLVDLPFWYHMAIGSFAFGAVFMATDPVSAAATNPGKWIYGFLIGFLILVIRVANPAYPEAVMLAILFMNVMAPLVDHYVVQAHIKRRASHVYA